MGTKTYAMIDGEHVLMKDIEESIRDHDKEFGYGPITSGPVKHGKKLKGKISWSTVNDWLLGQKIIDQEQKTTLLKLKKNMGIANKPPTSVNLKKDKKEKISKAASKTKPGIFLCTKEELLQAIALHYTKTGSYPRASTSQAVKYGALAKKRTAYSVRDHKLDWHGVSWKMSQGLVEGVPHGTTLNDFLKQKDVLKHMENYANPNKGRRIHARLVFNHVASALEGAKKLDLNDEAQIGRWRVGKLKAAFTKGKIIGAEDIIEAGNQKDKSVTLENFMLATELARETRTGNLRPGPMLASPEAA